MPRVKKSKNPAADSENTEKVKTIATQTSIDDDSIEIARLQEQVRLLTIENAVLRVHTAKVNIATSNAVNDLPLRPQNSVVKEQTLPINIEVKAVNEVTEQMMNPPRSAKKGIKGCSCKGNCSTKVCGCVKKDKKCAETCKCNDSLCENKPDTNDSNDDKENNDTTVVANKTPLKVVDKNKRRRGLFSPNEQDHLFSPSDDKISSTTSSESNLNDTGIRFGQTPVVESSHTVSEREEEKTIPLVENSEKSKKIGVHTAVQKESKVPEKEGMIDNVVIKSEPPATPVINDQDSSSNINVDQQDTEICPFKPKRHLPRTPPQKSKETVEKTVVISPAELPSNDSPPSPLHCVLSLSNVREQTPQTKPLDAIDSAAVLELPESVDWEQHQAQLVSCRKCKRKFMPQRIEKHEACCKKM